MSREECLRVFFEVLLFILCKKRGNFYYFSLNIFSKFYRKLTRTYIKILRHSSLNNNVLIHMESFKSGSCIIRELSTFKKYKIIFRCISHSHKKLIINFYKLYTFRKASYSVLNTLKHTYCKLDNHSKITILLQLPHIMPYHPCLSLIST